MHYSSKAFKKKSKIKKKKQKIGKYKKKHPKKQMTDPKKKANKKLTAINQQKNGKAEKKRQNIGQQIQPTFPLSYCQTAHHIIFIKQTKPKILFALSQKKKNRKFNFFSSKKICLILLSIVCLKLYHSVFLVKTIHWWQLSN